MRKMLFVFLIALSGCALVTSDGNEKINNIYRESDTNNVTFASLNCEGVVGSVADCSECYSCDDPAVQRHREKQHNIRKLKLNDANCASSEDICCVSQSLLRFREKEPDRTTCGNHNPEGKPRALRASIRSVLQGEYPWRAWIYRYSDFEKPLCAATYVNQEGRTLVTAASCVSGLRADQLLVLFDKDPDNHEPITVNRVDIHENYDKNSHVNDIAALSVQWIPQWAQRVCLPIQPVLHGSACVAVSSDDYFINQAVPRQENCADETTGPLHSSLMCAAAHRGDYAPELGAGLYCVDEQLNSNVYTLYGIYLYSASDGMAAINSNVAHHGTWLTARALEHRRS